MSQRYFKISSSLKNLIGRDLITDDFVAIFELVKNSIDAGASKVDIYFDLAPNSNGRIYIIDNGKGMSENDFLEKWLFVAYSAKSDGTEDNNSNKIYAGSKGVGRFSCDRLGSQLHIQSKVKSQKEVSCLRINWGDFEVDQSAEFQAIKVDITSQANFSFNYSPLKLNKNGLAIEISDLRDTESWNRKKLLNLKWNLQKLLNPFVNDISQPKISLYCQKENSKDSEILQTDDYDSSVIVNGVIENFIIEVLENKTTCINSILSDEYITTTLIDRGELIYKIQEKIPDEFKVLIGSNCNIDIFHLNRAAKTNFHRIMKVRAVDYGSIFLFKNNYRIYPAGERGNDYWGIDFKKMQGIRRYLGSRDVIGQVQIFGDSPGFKESSSRDKGFIDSVESVSLNKFLLFTLKKLEAYTVNVLWKDTFDKDLETPEQMFAEQNKLKIIQLVSKLVSNDNIELLEYSHDIVSILDEKSNKFENSLSMLSAISEKTHDSVLRREISKAQKLLRETKKSEIKAISIANKERKTRKEVEKVVAEKEEEVINTKKAYEEEKKLNLFLKGQLPKDRELLEDFTHQMVIHAAEIREIIDDELKALSNNSKLTKETYFEALSEIAEHNNKVLVLAKLAISADFRLDADVLDSDICHYIVEYLSNIATAYNTKISIHHNLNSCSKHMKFFPIEISMVIDNLISNAFKARAKNIYFEFSENKTHTILMISNDGVPLDKSIIEPNRIFEKGFSRTNNGSGLGLYHCKEHLKNIDATIQLAGSNNSSNICFEIRI